MHAPEANSEPSRQALENDDRSRTLRHKLKVWGQGRECLKHRKSVSWRTTRTKSVDELFDSAIIESTLAMLIMDSVQDLVIYPESGTTEAFCIPL